MEDLFTSQLGVDGIVNGIGKYLSGILLSTVGWEDLWQILEHWLVH